MEFFEIHLLYKRMSLLKLFMLQLHKSFIQQAIKSNPILFHQCSLNDE